MTKIASKFKEYFAGYDLELPDPIPPKGQIDKNGWSITYVLHNDDTGSPYLDFFAEHRLTSPKHVRIFHDGKLLGLETYQESYSYDPEIEGDEERAIKEMEEHNNRVSEALKLKGIF